MMKNIMKVQIKRISDKYNDLPLPGYATEGSAGMDVCAALDAPLTLAPGATFMVPTNLAIALEPGYECQVRSRSGLAAKNGVFALNAPGTVDSDYRGEIKVILSNFSQTPFTINSGDRIAQLVIAKYERAEFIECKELSDTERGAGGFGSTGV